MKKITEFPSPYRQLEQKTTLELLTAINSEDQSIARAVASVIPAIEPMVESTLLRMQQGGRLFYIGAGTSGRLGVLDASEIPPTFGAPADWVNGIIAGGDRAIRHAVESAEDDPRQAWRDLKAHLVNSSDTVVGIAASGTTPYVVGGLEDCRSHGITTVCITCNPETPLAAAADFPIEVITGPEFLTGSTRMKAGTAQKLVLNMISTTLMIRLGRVLDNQMVDMKLSNDKLIDRGARMLVKALGMEYDVAREKLLQHGSVRAVLEIES